MSRDDDWEKRAEWLFGKGPAFVRTPEPPAYVMDRILPDPLLFNASSNIGPAIAECVAALMDANPAPSDALLPIGKTRWAPRVVVEERNGRMLARVEWDAK